MSDITVITAFCIAGKNPGECSNDCPHKQPKDKNAYSIDMEYICKLFNDNTLYLDSDGETDECGRDIYSRDEWCIGVFGQWPGEKK